MQNHSYSRRVPPHVHENDVVAACEVETRAAGLERDEDDVDLRLGLDGFEHLDALLVTQRAVV
jgi:hypothetical protein